MVIPTPETGLYYLVVSVDGNFDESINSTQVILVQDTVTSAPLEGVEGKVYVHNANRKWVSHSQQVIDSDGKIRLYSIKKR